MSARVRNHFSNHLAAALFNFLVNPHLLQNLTVHLLLYLNLPVENMMESKQLFLRMIKAIMCLPDAMRAFSNFGV